MLTTKQHNLLLKLYKTNKYFRVSQLLLVNHSKCISTSNNSINTTKPLSTSSCSNKRHANGYWDDIEIQKQYLLNIEQKYNITKNVS